MLIGYFFGCHSDNLLILLVVGFDALSYRQENICSKFNGIKTAVLFGRKHRTI